MSFVESLLPGEVWRQFARLLAIPRPSGREEQIMQHITETVGRRGLEYHTDQAGNLVARKPGSPGRQAEPFTTLQAHVDMVTVKDHGIVHDFRRDPIRAIRDGAYLAAQGTTLGADNGIGVAAMLAVAESTKLLHGPTELLFTVREETGMTGALQLDERLLVGRRLINLDSEDGDAICVGCAGGARTSLLLSLTLEPAPHQWVPCRVIIGGLRGGHSGLNMELRRANAILVLARLLNAAARYLPLRLCSLSADGKHNAIPREASAVVLLPFSDVERFRNHVGYETQALVAEFGSSDPDLEVEITDEVQTPAAWTEATTNASLRLLDELPNGVIAYSATMPGAVETSANLASAVVRNGALEVLCSIRSFSASTLESLRERIRATGLAAGAQVHEPEGYPPWPPNPAAPLVADLQNAFHRVTGNLPRLTAIHAGLECAVIGARVPGMEMASIGPTIENAHSPAERVGIDSVARFWNVLVASLEHPLAEARTVQNRSENRT